MMCDLLKYGKSVHLLPNMKIMNKLKYLARITYIKCRKFNGEIFRYFQWVPFQLVLCCITLMEAPYISGSTQLRYNQGVRQSCHQ